MCEIIGVGALGFCDTTKTGDYQEKVANRYISEYGADHAVNRVFGCMSVTKHTTVNAVMQQAIHHNGMAGAQE